MDNYQFFLSKLLEIQQIIAENVKIILKLLEKYDQLLPIINRDLDSLKLDTDSISSDIKNLESKVLQNTKIDNIQNLLNQLLTFTNNSSKLFNRVYTEDELNNIGQFVVWIKDIHNFTEIIKNLIAKVKIVACIFGFVISIGSFIWVNWGVVSKLLIKFIR